MANIAASNAGSFGLLPNEANYMIFKRLDKKSLVRISHTCKAMYTVCRNDHLWKPINQFFVSKQLLADCKQAALDNRTSYLNLAVAVNAPHSVIREFFQAQAVPNRETMLIALSCRKNLSIMQEIHDHSPSTHGNFQLGMSEFHTAAIIKNPKVFALQACHGLTNYPDFKLKFICHIIQSVRQLENWEQTFHQQFNDRYDYLEKLVAASNREFFDLPSKKSFDESIKKMVIGSYPTCLSYIQSTEFPQFKEKERSYPYYAKEYQAQCDGLKCDLEKFQAIEPILEEAKKLLATSFKKMSNSEPMTTPMETD